MKRAFSLLEVVVVMGLIIGVAVVVLPALRSARERALSAQCKTNLHQLAVTCLNYTMNEGVFPWGMIEPDMHENRYWKTEAYRKVYPLENPARHHVARWSDYASFCWDFTRRRDDLGWKSGEMFGGLEAASVFSCPKCTDESDNWDGNHITGYNYNVCYLG